MIIIIKGYYYLLKKIIDFKTENCGIMLND